MNVGPALELIRPWLTTAFIGSILAMIVKLYVDNRRLRLAERSRDQDFQLEVSADGRTNLQFVIDNLVRDITSQREAHARCESELAEIRTENTEQGKRLAGVERQFINFQISVARAIPPGDRTPVLADLLRQLDELAVETGFARGGDTAPAA